MTLNKKRIGILAVQGAFAEHEKAVEKLGAVPVELRQRPDIHDIDGLILPGGESTVQGKLLRELDMFDILKDMIDTGVPVLATCAGLILLAEDIENDSEHYFSSLPVKVKRNAYGRQLGSFVRDNELSYGNNGSPEPMVFIRAPLITGIGNGCRALAGYDDRVTGVKYKNQIALSFHPELTEDLEYHEMLLDEI